MRLSNNTTSLILICSFITAIIICIYAIFRNVDNRLYVYFMVFAAGIISRRIDLFNENIIKRYVPVFAVGLVLAFLAEFIFFDNGNFIVHSFNIQNAISSVIFLIVRNILLISISVLTFWAVGSLGSQKKINKTLLPQISFGSYAAYLFDVICFALVQALALQLNIGGYYLDLAILLVAFPLVFVAGYYIQKTENFIKQFVIDLLSTGARRTGSI